MLLEVSPGNVSGMLEGSRLPHTVDLILDLAEILPGTKQIFSFTPVTLPAPDGLQDKSLWKLARRGWFGAIQPCAIWGDCSHGYGCGSAGILANNVISDPASVSSMFYADLIFFTPEIVKGIPAAQLTRRTVEFWVKKRALGSHEIPGYADYVDFLDSNPQQLICAWDYVESTSDLPWLEGMIGRLEGVAEFTARRDQDLDGLVEAAQSGNAGTLWINNRSSNWFDAVNYGHKDAYSNALIYRAWRCLADLEAKLNRTKQQQHYTELADRLKTAYMQQLLNPKTGWITCWKSADGSFHDYCSPIINSMAISYGLVEPEQGRQILDRLWDGCKRSSSTASIWEYPQRSILCTAPIICSLSPTVYLSAKTEPIPFNTIRMPASRPATPCTSWSPTIRSVTTKKLTACCARCSDASRRGSSRMVFREAIQTVGSGPHGKANPAATKAIWEIPTIFCWLC